MCRKAHVLIGKHDIRKSVLVQWEGGREREREGEREREVGGRESKLMSALPECIMCVGIPVRNL